MTFYEQKVITKVLILCAHVPEIVPILCPRQADPVDSCAGHSETIYDPVACHVLSAMHETIMIHQSIVVHAWCVIHSLLCTVA